MKKLNGFEENEYTSRIRIKPKRLEWLKKNRDKKSAAAFLDEIIESHIHIKKLF